MYLYSLDELISRYPELNEIKDKIASGVDIIEECLKNGGKLLLCGNGGSEADCDHITGELLKGFLSKRPVSEERKADYINCIHDKELFLSADDINNLQYGLPAVSLCSLTALNTAFCNDVDPSLVYAQGVFALGNNNDVLICISTSGNSANVVKAASVAKLKNMKVISLTGKTGGRLKSISDINLNVDETETFKVQELHLPIYHYLCAEVERRFFG